jgi:hypothetical protein
MDIIHVPIKVGLIPDEMLPKSALPETALTPLGTASRNALAFIDGTGKPSLDDAPARRKSVSPGGTVQTQCK